MIGRQVVDGFGLEGELAIGFVPHDCLCQTISVFCIINMGMEHVTRSSLLRQLV